MAGKIRITTTTGGRGMFPLMYDDDGPMNTGKTCKNYTQCVKSAIAWAKAEFGDEWKEHTDLRED